MSEPGIALILTGPKHSRKTTRLSAWAAGRGDVAGLLQPSGPHGRFFRDIASGETVALEPVLSGEEIVPVGRFRFRADAFAWANARLQAVAARHPRYVLIDEAGPFELAGGGLRPGIAAVLASGAGTVLLVVRDELAEAMRCELVPQARIVPCAGWPQVGQKDASAP